MSKENKMEVGKSRRKFLKGAGKAVVIAPAAGLILNASKANAVTIPDNCAPASGGITTALRTCDET